MTSQRQKFAGLLASTVTVATGLALVAAPPAVAAPTDVVINEMMFHALSDLDGDDYLELFNRGATAVDLSGWTFSGVTLTVPAGTTIDAGGFLVVAKDAVQFQATYGFARPRSTAATCPTPARLSPSRTRRRHHRHGLLPRRRSLAVTADGTGPSLELIDASLTMTTRSTGPRRPTHRAARPAPPTRCAGSAGPPRDHVVIDPTTPPANQPVAVTADDQRPDERRAPLPHRLQHRADPDHDGQRRRHLLATIPGAGAGHLIRYRVEATNANATTRSPRIDDTSSTAASSCRTGSPARSR